MASKMTLEEAISYADHVAQTNVCPECGQEHAQLADWLRELIALRSAVIQLEKMVRIEEQNFDNEEIESLRSIIYCDGESYHE
jgi:DNA repair exonuclease SbcCD ATPase subunit